MSIEKIKIVKLFASDEYNTRNRAYKTITKLMKFGFGDGQRQLNKKEVISIWKGLYVWLWMQDKPLLHEEVVSKICQLLKLINSDELAIEFIDAFFVTMLREWRKIDVHRIDKFYMLTRDFFATCLLWIQTKKDSNNFVALFSAKVINGVMDQGIEFKLHIIDILLDELMRAQSSTTLSTGIVLGCIRSMINISQKHAYVIRMRKRVIDRLVPLYNESKLQIDLKKIGIACLSMAEKEEMFGKMRKLCYYLSNRFANCTKSDTEKDEQCAEKNEGDQGTPTIEEETEVVNTTEEQPNDEKVCEQDEEAKEEADPKDTEAEVENGMEMDADTEEDVPELEAMDEESSEQSTEEDTEVVAPAVLKVVEKAPKMKTKKQLNEKKQLKVVNQSCSKDKKVTFGKKYIKKFKKSDVKVAMSQGTVKNENMRSILKKA